MSLKLNMFIKSVSLINNIEKLIFNVIISSFCLLSLLYIVFLGNMVKNVVERKSLEADAHTLSSEVKDLELTYLSMSKNIDLNLSYSMKFKEVQPTFSTRKTFSFGSLKDSNSMEIVKNDL